MGKSSVFRVADRGRGRIALQAEEGKHVSVAADGEVSLKAGRAGDGETFQWIDLQRGDVLLLSLATHRYLVAGDGPVRGDHAGPSPDRKDGSCFRWQAGSR